MQLIAITRKSALPAILLLVVILVATTLRSHISPFALELENSIYRESAVISILSAFFFFCAGFVEGRMLPRSGLHKGYCALPIPLFGLLACGIFMPPNALAASSASLFFAIALYQLTRSLHVAGEKESVFVASMLLGATLLIYPPSIVLVGVLPIAILVLALSLQQVVLMIVGYLLPLFGASYIMWYCGSDFMLLSQNIIEYLAIPNMELGDKIPYFAILLVVAVVAILVWGGVYSIISAEKMFMLARIRRALHLFLWVSTLSLSMIAIPACDLSACAIIAVPITIMLSLSFELLPKNYSTISYWVLLLLFALHLFFE